MSKHLILSQRDVPNSLLVGKDFQRRIPVAFCHTRERPVLRLLCSHTEQVVRRLMSDTVQSSQTSRTPERPLHPRKALGRLFLETCLGCSRARPSEM